MSAHIFGLEADHLDVAHVVVTVHDGELERRECLMVHLMSNGSIQIRMIYVTTPTSMFASPCSSMARSSDRPQHEYSSGVNTVVHTLT